MTDADRQHLEAQLAAGREAEVLHEIDRQDCPPCVPGEPAERLFAMRSSMVVAEVHGSEIVRHGEEDSDR